MTEWSLVLTRWGCQPLLIRVEASKAFRITSRYDSLLSSPNATFQFEAVWLPDESVVSSSVDRLCDVVTSNPSLEWVLCTSLLPNAAGIKAVQECEFKGVFYEP